MDKRNKDTKPYRISLVVIASIFVICLVGILAIILYSGHSDKQVLNMSWDWDIDDEKNEEIYVKVTRGTPWDSDRGLACQFDAVIVNKTKYVLRNWSVTCEVPERAKTNSMWNGVWLIEGTKATFTPIGVAEQVPAFSQQTFGLVMYTKEPCDITEITLEFTKTLPPTGYVMFWIFIAVGVLCLVISVMLIISYINMRNYTRTHAAYKDLVNESLRTIANIIDTKDEYTRGHSIRVAIYSRMLAQRMGMSEHDQERIYYIGMLHDIGKIGIPTSILTKPGRLTDEEFEIIKKHTRMGASIMKDFSSIEGVVDGIRYHHERYDGRGYNEGLKGNEIPLEGRIICVADSYDAMSSRRCYRNSLDYDYILNELIKGAGTQFDPDIVKHMIDMVQGGYAPISEAEMEYSESDFTEE